MQVSIGRSGASPTKKGRRRVPAACGSVVMDGSDGRGGASAGFAEVHLEIAEIDWDVVISLFEGFLIDLGPALGVVVEHVRLATPLVLALAVDAAIGVWQGVETSLGDLTSAELAAAVDARGDPLESVLDLAELPALDLHELRADLVIGRVDRGIDVVADDAELGEFAEAIEIAIEGLAQCVSPRDQSACQSKQSIFAGHEYTSWCRSFADQVGRNPADRPSEPAVPSRHTRRKDVR